MSLTPRLRWIIVTCGVLVAAGLLSTALYVVNVQNRLDRLEADRAARLAQRDTQIDQLTDGVCAFLESLPQTDPRLTKLEADLRCTPAVPTPGATTPPPLSLEPTATSTAAPTPTTTSTTSRSTSTATPQPDRSPTTRAATPPPTVTATVTAPSQTPKPSPISTTAAPPLSVLCELPIVRLCPRGTP